jgi:hypothetical protein
MSSFCHFVVSTKYILNSIGERGQPWHTLVLISASFEDLELNFVDIYFVFG